MARVSELNDVQDSSAGMTPKRIVVIFCALALALFISCLDQTSVATSMPKIGEELDAVSSITWVGTSFLIAYTAFLLVNGRLSDIFGRKGCLLLSLALLGVGDLLCGFARSAVMLFVFRAVSGVGAGGVNSLVMVVVSDITTLKERGKYQGYLEIMIALGNGLGPLIGGAFSENVSWRWTFWLVVPLAGVAAGVVTLLLPQTKVEGDWRTKIAQIDYFGVFAGMGTVLLLLIPISGGGSTYAWNSALVVSMLTLGGVLAVVFVLVEWKVSHIPVMPLRLFNKTATKVLFTHNFLTGVVYYIKIYYLPLFFQNVRGYSPLMSGVLILPLILAFSVGSSSSGIIIARIGHTNPVLWSGYLLWTVGAGGMIAFGRDTHLSVLIVVQLIEGVGVGCVFQPAMIAILANTEKPDRAVATGLRNFLRTIGGAVGLSIASAVVNNTVLGNLPAGVTGNEALLFGAGEKLSSEQMRGLVEAYMKGLRIVFVLVCPLMGACLVSSFLLVDVELAGVREEGGVVAVAAAGKSYVDIEVGRDESASDVEKQGEIIEGGKG